MSGRPDFLDPLVAGLRRRVAEQRRAEGRLADFAFSETAEPAAGSAVSDVSPASTPSTASAAPAWRYYVGRALRAAGDPETLALLESLRGGPLTVAEVAGRPEGGGDRIAAADWIGGLSAAGFVTRELEADRVVLAPLGAATLDLVEELERRLAETDGAP